MASYTREAQITVRTVGESFGCEASVKRGRKVLHTTRVFPHGFRASAFAKAQEWCEANGVDLRPEDEAQQE